MTIFRVENSKYECLSKEIDFSTLDGHHKKKKKKLPIPFY